jgi:hypothetical protein
MDGVGSLLEVPNENGVQSGHSQPARARRLCPRLTRAGRPCGWPPMRGSQFCWNHDERPAVAQRRAASKRVAVRMRVDWGSPEGTLRQVKRIVAAVEAGTMSRRRGDVLVKALRAAVRAQKTLDRVKAQRPVEIRVKVPAWLRQDRPVTLPARHPSSEQDAQ